MSVRHMRLRFTARAVLAALLAAAVLPALGLAHSTDAEDLARGDGSFVSHHPITQFEALRGSVADDHCIACHLLRAVSSARPRPLGYVGSGAVRVAGRFLISGPLQPGKRRGLTSRGPPNPSTSRSL